tara:strand:+ start:110 stop:283 length:174 start_codon:yes stop_codon:yes gene_type:complete
MPNNEIKQFIENNSQLIADKVNAYTAACNIKFSEFNEEQQHKLKITLAAIEVLKMIP